MSDWNASLYLKFDSERTLPAQDLAAHIERGEPESILDLGCGPGNSTQVLALRYPHARILGIDRSPNMVASARKLVKCYPRMQFEVCDAATDLGRLPAPFDIIFANASIQWIPDHAALIPTMLSLLRPGGMLAVQTPMNYDEPIHRIITETVASSVWAPHFPQPRIFFNLTPDEYYDILTESAGAFRIWQTTYYHTMKSHTDILEWYRGTGLRPYLDVLTETERAPFEREIFEKLISAYPRQKNGDILFRFPRFFFTATARSK